MHILLCEMFLLRIRQAKSFLAVRMYFICPIKTGKHNNYSRIAKIEKPLFYMH